MAAKHLSGMNILVTRPKETAEKLIIELENLGAKVLWFPIIAIGGLPLTAKSISSLEHLSDYDIVIFTSQNAVLHGVPWFQTYAGQAGKKPVFAAIGAATKKLLEHFRFEVTLYPRHEFGSEGLLALPDFQMLQKKRILIITGEHTRALLPEILEKRGAVIDIIECYRRIILQSDAHAVMEFHQQFPLDFIIATSHEILQNLVAILGANRETILKNAKVVVLNQHNAIKARALGCKKVISCEKASDAGIIHALIGRGV